jgi:hypothetical protein
MSPFWRSFLFWFVMVILLVTIGQLLSKISP